MSFENKGSMPPTIVISRDPDRSGNLICDGTADDVQIQAAIDEITRRGGGLIFIKAGTYAISASLVMKDNVSIAGEGIDVTILQAIVNLDDILMYNSRAAVGSDPKNTNMHISDLTMDGDGANQVSGFHIVANNTTILFYEYAENFSFKRVKFYDGQDYNLRLGFAGNCLDGLVEKCIIDLNRDSGGGLVDGSGQRMAYVDCEAMNSALSGFWHWGKNITFTRCRSHDHSSAGFGCEGTTEGSTEYVRFVDCLSYGNAHGMQLFGCRYIQVIGGSYSLNNNHGIWVHSRVTPLATHDVTIKGVDVINNNVSDGAYYGINISGRSGDYNRNIKVQGCTIADDRGTALQDRGIECEYVQDSIFEGNIIYENLAEGIRLNTFCDRVKIRNNIIFDNDWYQINVNNSNCDDNEVMGNYLSATNRFSDSGTNTKFATKTFQFQHGGSAEGTVDAAEFVSATASAKGWQVDGGTDWAVALGQLPADLLRIVRIKIWAVALGAPIGAGGHMHLEIVMNAGADDLIFSTENVALTNFDGVTTDYIADDVIHWDVDPGDDADIGSMVGGMSIEFKVIYEAGADPDGATNAVFRAVEVLYV